MLYEVNNTKPHDNEHRPAIKKHLEQVRACLPLQYDDEGI